MRRAFITVFLFCLLLTALSVSGQGMLGVEVTDFSEPLSIEAVVSLEEYDTPFFLRAGTISPDGLRIAYVDREGICVIDIVTSGSPPEPDCTAFLPETGRLRVSALYWSPDSRYVAFHEDAVFTFRDSDLMLLDTERNFILNVTNDNFADSLMDVVRDDTGEVSIMLDFSPVWVSEQELYFWRSVYSSAEEIPTTLNRINIETLEVTELALLTTDPADLMSIVARPSSMGFANVTSISPSGRYAAAVVTPFEMPNTRVVVVDLETAEVETVVTFDQLLEISPPILEDTTPVPTGVEWLPDESGVLISTFNTASRANQTNIFQVTFEDSRILPLIDLSIVQSESELNEPVGGFAPVSLIPRFAAVTPDRSTVIWAGALEGRNVFWSASLPLPRTYSPEAIPYVVGEIETDPIPFQNTIGVFNGTIRVLGAEDLITLSP